MQNNPTTHEEMKTIRISSELYDYLHEYCDKENIRFGDFVEDSLENAVDLNEQFKLIEESEKLLSQIKDDLEKAYKSGFQKGFCIAFHTVRGEIWAGLKDDSLKKNLENNPPKPVEGPQLKLF